MSRLRVLLIAALLSGCVAAPSPQSPQPDRSLTIRLFKGLFEQVISERDTSSIDKFVAFPFIIHIRADSIIAGRSEAIALVQQVRDGFPDLRLTVKDVVDGGDKAAVRLSFDGTNTGRWRNYAPSGSSVHASEMFICNIQLRKLKECWQEWDEAGVIRQVTGGR